jgi:putative protease
VFELRNLDVSIQGQPMIPFSVLGQLRRELIEQLESTSLCPRRTIAEPGVLDRLRASIAPSSSAHPNETNSPSTLRVLCRTLEQLRKAAEQGTEHLYVEFQDIREYGEAVATAHANGSKTFVATPRIQKPNELGVFSSIAKHGADGILARNFGGMRFFKNEGFPIVADFSMNVTNELSAEFLIGQGAERVTASYDLNREQLFDLVSAVPSHWLEIVIHQHMPMFHMEHCVFCAVLSPGTNKTNCGRPCDIHKVELRDRIGMEHPLTADVGCRNTLYNAVPQSSAEITSALQTAGIADFRIELLREDGAQVTETIQLYRGLLKGSIAGHEVWRKLRANDRVGVTRGTLEERNPLAII